jgi:predicted metal-binding membrane protein
MTIDTAPTRHSHRGVYSVIALAWLLAIITAATGHANALHHHTLIEHGPTLWVGVPLFVLSWQVMIAAMMLPSSLPFIRLFNRASASRPQAQRALAALLVGYASVWTAFGIAAFVGDMFLHATVDRTPWLEAHQQVIGGGVLLLAGGFQFSALKDRCLDACRHPAAFILPRYRQGARAAFDLGIHHGLFCLGCCWALMLVSFAIGVANLPWMALFTAVMVFEKTGPHGDRGMVPIGAGLMGLGVLVLLGPAAGVFA